MANFFMGNLIVILGAVFFLLIGILLAVIFQHRLSKRRSPLGGTSQRVQLGKPGEPSSKHKTGLQSESQEFGLYLELNTDEVINIDLPTTIGRSDENTIVIDDDSMSSNHAKIYFDESLGAVVVEDLESLNGVFIDGRPTVKNILIDSVRLTLGSYTLTFRDTGYLPSPNQKES